MKRKIKNACLNVCQSSNSNDAIGIDASANPPLRRNSRLCKGNVQQQNTSDVNLHSVGQENVHQIEQSVTLPGVFKSKRLKQAMSVTSCHVDAVENTMSKVNTGEHLLESDIRTTLEHTCYSQSNNANHGTINHHGQPTCTMNKGRLNQTTKSNRSCTKKAHAAKVSTHSVSTNHSPTVSFTDHLTANVQQPLLQLEKDKTAMPSNIGPSCMRQESLPLHGSTNSATTVVQQSSLRINEAETVNASSHIHQNRRKQHQLLIALKDMFDNSAQQPDASPVYEDLGDCTYTCRYYKAAFWHGSDRAALDPTIVEGLIEFLDHHNELVQIFRTARDKCTEADVPDFKVRLYNGDGARTYELPTSDALGAIVFDSGPATESDYDVIIEYKDGPPKRINKLHQSYMSLQFLLIFIYGQPGYHTNLKLRSADPNEKMKRVSMNAFYTYQLHPRHDQPIAFVGQILARYGAYRAASQ
ncbi:helitron helicase-like domain-containing protein [Artemisia annua]|uniref:Helitron helicase-like domain-containing protein n=1 Tax=Artemisia annua TaxID=35608 RepID=A0A2U1LMT3_ARTAN|nr:helitron helicase-like domain-containing protein [Artemisia annua]